MNYDYHDILRICDGFNNMADILLILMKLQKEAEDLGEQSFWKFDKDLAKETGYDMHLIELGIYHLAEIPLIKVIRQDEKTGDLQRAYYVDLNRIKKAVEDLHHNEKEKENE